MWCKRVFAGHGKPTTCTASATLSGMAVGWMLSSRAPAAGVLSVSGLSFSPNRPGSEPGAFWWLFSGSTFKAATNSHSGEGLADTPRMLGEAALGRPATQSEPRQCLNAARDSLHTGMAQLVKHTKHTLEAQHPLTRHAKARQFGAPLGGSHELEAPCQSATVATALKKLAMPRSLQNKICAGAWAPENFQKGSKLSCLSYPTILTSQARLQILLLSLARPGQEEAKFAHGRRMMAGSSSKPRRKSNTELRLRGAAKYLHKKTQRPSRKEALRTHHEVKSAMLIKKSVQWHS